VAPPRCDRTPAVGTLLDLFGTMPPYVFVEIVFVAAAWALMTWPGPAPRQEGRA
jgi:hypothetical protein